ncbi:hypothetical protein PFISCL1PPCAC_7276, partial [Pristionchus fissidentatus]
DSSSQGMVSLPKTIEDWKKKFIDLSSSSTDAMPSLFSTAVEAMNIVLLNDQASDSRVKFALHKLKDEQELCMGEDRRLASSSPHRLLGYGLISCLQMSLQQFADN